MAKIMRLEFITNERLEEADMQSYLEKHRIIALCSCIHRRFKLFEQLDLMSTSNFFQLMDLISKFTPLVNITHTQKQDDHQL